jgi:ATP-dependent Clp protease protease subunit
MIKAFGIIGNEANQYSLVRLIQDVKKQPENEPLHILINSPGGDGELAFDMHDYLRTLKRTIITESKGECASAASTLFLAGDRRIAGCPIMIHNPWTTVQGDSTQLQEASQWISKFEKRCEKFYAQKTGLDQQTISNLMNKETYISPTEAVSLKFATKAKQTAMALINNTNNLKTKKMAKTKKGETRLQRALAVLLGEDDPEVNMLELTAANGDVIVIEREEGEPQAGDAASPDGTHVMPDGATIVVTDGVITEIIPAETDEEIEQLRTENAQLKEQLATARANAKSTEEINQLNAIKIAGGTQWLAKQCSAYKPVTRKAAATATTKEGSQRESRSAKRLAELQAKRAQQA